jgi:hypothetical protein
MNLPLLHQVFKFQPQLSALERAELLRIINPTGFTHRPATFEEFWGDEHRGRDHWSRQRATTGLIDANETAQAKYLLKIESTKLTALSSHGL